MTFEKAVQIYSEALSQYHDQWYGHGSSVGPFSATDRGRASWSNSHTMALKAPEEAAALIIESAGIDMMDRVRAHFGLPSPAEVQFRMKRTYDARQARQHGYETALAQLLGGGMPYAEAHPKACEAGQKAAEVVWPECPCPWKVEQ